MARHYGLGAWQCSMTYIAMFDMSPPRQDIDPIPVNRGHYTIRYCHRRCQLPPPLYTRRALSLTALINRSCCIGDD